MISCYIISEQKTVDLLSHHIERFPLTMLLGHSCLISKDLGTISKLKPKIVFVDASLLHKCKATLLCIAQLCTVIYISDCKNTAIDAFDALGFDYILKSHTYERFEMSINKFVQFALRAPEPIKIHSDIITNSFFIKADSKGLKEIRINCAEVLYIEAEQNYVNIHMVNGKKHTTHNTMKEMEECLPEKQFGRVHKSFIINYEKITIVEGNDIYLSENERPKIRIGYTYRKAFHEKKNQILIKRKSFLEVLDFSRNASILFLCFKFYLQVAHILD